MRFVQPRAQIRSSQAILTGRETGTQRRSKLFVHRPPDRLLHLPKLPRPYLQIRLPHHPLNFKIEIIDMRRLLIRLNQDDRLQPNPPRPPKLLILRPRLAGRILRVGSSLVTSSTPHNRCLPTA